jgi:Fe-S cluster biogenesis protein NfuA
MNAAAEGEENVMSDAAAETTHRIARALDAVTPRLRGHAGDVELVSVEDGEVQLKFTGACAGCPALPFTFVAAIEPALMDTPGVRSIASRQLHASSSVLARIRQSLGVGQMDHDLKSRV